MTGEDNLSDNDAFALNDKDDLFLSELGNILLEEEKLTDQWMPDQNNDDDIHSILASCERKKEQPLKKQNSIQSSPNVNNGGLSSERLSQEQKSQTYTVFQPDLPGTNSA